ncbi:TPA: ribosome biogenesis GTPase Der [Candidatus Uhrbacteria bacterium]|nr:MAG: GTPase Der [Parcubacteria group bacterium GW2011_GWA2_53_21]OGL71413.1 MAG: ribosome biogenesis GTPase Der [Candidatus Uhrbacteria bacterium RIFCSPHIGHO2_02_FULL_54_11]HBL39084.1 ribosome biogenesis GTPase Der [Candidatus Uhrbacteria bacterium]
MPLPTIAIVGRANVGKSTLFNRLLESRKALVSPVPGTTRDRAEGECIWRARVIRVLDTGGVDIRHPSDIEAEILRQSDVAMREADVVLFLVDGEVPLTDFDRAFGAKIESLGKPFVIAVNKADTSAARDREDDAWTWRYGVPRRVSAARGHGVGDLLDEIFERLKAVGKPAADIVDMVATRVTVIGKPNVGKSSILNKLLGEERFIVSVVEHTTREPNDTRMTHDGRDYVFVDTAGIRRSSLRKKLTGLETQAVKKSLQSIKRSDVVLFVIEAQNAIGAQERILAGKLAESHAGTIIVVNKWDLIGGKETNTMKEAADELRFMLPMLQNAPVVFVSALTGSRVEKLFDVIDTVQRHRFAEFTDEELETFLKRAIIHHRPAKGMGSAPPKILGLKQIGTAPPRFELALKSRHKKKLQESYVRYLENRFHDEFGLEGTPIIIHVKPVQAG